MSGAIVVFAGVTGSGKTTAAMKHAAAYSRRDRVVMFDPIPEDFPVDALSELRRRGYLVIATASVKKRLMDTRIGDIYGTPWLPAVADRVFLVNPRGRVRLLKGREA